MHVCLAVCDTLLPNLVSVGNVGGRCSTRIYCVVTCDGPLGCCMTLEVMSSLTGDRSSRGTHDVIDHIHEIMLPYSRGQLVMHRKTARVCLLIHVGGAQANSRM
jgi:hypothetical protein